MSSTQVHKCESENESP